MIRQIPLGKLRTSLSYLRSEGQPPTAGFCDLPLVVVASTDEPGCYEVVDGFKRLRKAREAGQESVLVLVRQACGPKAKALLLGANSPQRTVTPMDEARVVYSLVHEDGMSLAQTARMLGRKRPWTSKRHALFTRLAKPLHKEVDQGHLRLSIAYGLTAIAQDKQLELVRVITTQGLSVAQAEAMLGTYRGLSSEHDRQALLRNPLGMDHTSGQAMDLCAQAVKKLAQYRQLTALLDSFMHEAMPAGISPAEARLLEAEKKVVQAKIMACAMADQNPYPQEECNDAAQ